MKTKTLLDKLEIGHSRLFPLTTKSSGSISYYAKRYGMKFSKQKLSYGIRVERIL